MDFCIGERHDRERTRRENMCNLSDPRNHNPVEYRGVNDWPESVEVDDLSLGQSLPTIVSHQKEVYVFGGITTEIVRFKPKRPSEVEV